MKLLYANNFLYRRGGSERVMFDEAAGFAARGHQTLFFGHRHPEAVTLPHAEHFPEPLDYAALRGFRKVSAAARVIHNGSAARRLRDLLRLSRPDLMHAHNIYAGLTPAIMLTAEQEGVPSLLTLHDYKLACPSYLMLDHGRVCDACVEGSFLNCVVRRCHKESVVASAVTTVEAMFNAATARWERARFFVCPSRFLRGVMLRHGIPEAKLCHIPNAVDLEEWPEGSDGEAYALYVGRLSPEKGVETLVRAAVGARLPVRVAGRGPDARRLEELTARLGANVRFEGYKSSGEVRALLRGASFLVLPSICYDNAPMTVIEAMAIGKPVVASDIGGIPELVEHGANGLLAPAGDVERLREAMNTLASDAKLRQEMGRASRCRAEQEFSLPVHLERLGALYQRVLS